MPCEDPFTRWNVDLEFDRLGQDEGLSLTFCIRTRGTTIDGDVVTDDGRYRSSVTGTDTPINLPTKLRAVVLNFAIAGVNVVLAGTTTGPHRSRRFMGRWEAFSTLPVPEILNGAERSSNDATPDGGPLPPPPPPPDPLPEDGDTGTGSGTQT